MTEATPRNPQPPSGGWRGKADISPGTAKQVNRVLLTLAAVALVAALGYLLWRWSFGPATRLVCLPVVEYQKLAVPPIPFSEKDVRPFERLPLAEPPTVWWNLGTSADMAKMPNRLDAIGGRPKDTLIFYVCAHGVSSGDEAYLLSSDYLLGSGNERYALGELLDLIRGVPGALKLLILDVGHIGSDPRLGMLANEFPRMLEQDLASGSKDSNLWVLSANRPLQLSHVSAHLQRSVFGHHVTEGLLGAADREGGNRDDRVDLGELYRYVCKGVRVRVNDEVGNADAQTPWLLRDGEGQVSAVPDEFLVLVSDEPAEDDSANRGAAEDSPDAAGGENPAAAKKPARQSMPKTLAAARALHDQIEARVRSRDPAGDAPSWAPVDYAPHRWRVFEELLVSYELQHLYGMPVSEDNLQRLLDDARAEWPEATGGLKSDAQVGFDPAAQGISRAGTIRALVQLKNALLCSAPYYVRWYVSSAQATAVSQTTVHELILDLLHGTRQFVDDYEAFEQAGLDEASPTDLQSRLESLERQADTLRDRDAALRQMLDEKVADLAKNPAARGNPAQIEILLGLPLLSGGQRTRLLDGLAEAKWPAPEIMAQTFDEEQLGRGATQFAERQKAMLPELAELEQALCLLAAPDEPIDPPPAVANPQPEAYRAFAAKLQEFYQGLPGMVNAVAATSSADNAAIRTAGRRLRMVLACDVEGKMSQRPDWPLVRGVLWREVALSGPAEPLRLSWREPAPLPLTIRTAGQPFDRATLTFTYDAAKLRIETADGMQTIEPGRPTPVALGREQTALRYRVVALADNTQEGSVDVRIGVDAGAQSGSCKATCLLPSPDAVRLAVYRVGAADLAMEEVGEGRIRLRPFPNRDTGFRFELQNLSDDPKQLEVRLLGVRNRPWGTAPTRAMLFDVSGSLRAEVEAIVPAVTMGLAAHAAAQTVPLALPEAPAPAASPAGAAAAEPAPKPSTWACAIYDKGDTTLPGPRWLYWLDFWPLIPREYLDVEGERPAYDADLGRLTIRAEARETDLRGQPILPGDLEANPIVVTWNPGRGGADLRNLRRQAKIATPGAVAELFADVAPEIGREVDVDLDVDGYPRGFMYQAQCQRNGQILDMQDRIAVRLTSPATGSAYRIPLEGPIAVAFQIDAPADAFIETPGVTAQPSVRLDFAGTEGAASFSAVEIARFASDRHVEVSVPKIGPTGVIMVRTRVSDFEIQTLNRGLENAKVRVRVRLELPNLNLPGDAGRREDSVEIVFDGEPPVVRVGPLGETLLGQPVRLSFDVEDLSGLARIQARLSETKEAKFEDTDTLNLSAVPDTDNRYRASLPTDAIQRAGAYWVVWQATDRAGNATALSAEAVSIRAPRPSATAAPTTGTIEGWVLSPEGDPRDGAQITLSPLGRAAVADGQGRFSFAEVPPGTYTLVVEQRIKGQPAATSRQLEVKAGQKTTIEKIELSMWSREGE